MKKIMATVMALMMMAAGFVTDGDAPEENCEEFIVSEEQQNSTTLESEWDDSQHLCEGEDIILAESYDFTMYLSADGNICMVGEPPEFPWHPENADEDFTVYLSEEGNICMVGEPPEFPWHLESTGSASYTDEPEALEKKSVSTGDAYDVSVC